MGLIDMQRIAFIKEFNDPHSDFTVLVMMYAGSSQCALRSRIIPAVAGTTAGNNKKLVATGLVDDMPFRW